MLVGGGVAEPEPADRRRDPGIRRISADTRGDGVRQRRGVVAVEAARREREAPQRVLLVLLDRKSVV